MDKRTFPNDVLLGEVAAVLSEGREAVIAPTGRSMLPFIREGRDRVVLRRLEHMEVGDIVLARIGSGYVMHRIVARDGDALTLMGDGNLRGQEHCSVSDVIGTVVEILRPSGQRRTPGPGRLWRALRPVRRWLLAFYKIFVLKEALF